MLCSVTSFGMSTTTGPRPPGSGDMECPFDRERKVFHLLHQDVVLDAGPRDADRVHFLKRVVADQRGAHLAGEHHQRHRIHVGVGDAGHGIGRARAGGHQHHPRLFRSIWQNPRPHVPRPAHGAPGCGRLPAACAIRRRYAARHRRGSRTRWWPPSSTRQRVKISAPVSSSVSGFELCFRLSMRRLKASRRACHALARYCASKAVIFQIEMRRNADFGPDLRPQC